MDEFHIEFLGKSAKVTLKRLPSLNPEPPIIEKTSLGQIAPLKAINGVNSRIESQTLTPEALIEGDPELTLDRAGLVLDPESLSTAYIDPSDKERVPVASFTQTDIVFDATGVEDDIRLSKAGYRDAFFVRWIDVSG